MRSSLCGRRPCATRRRGAARTRRTPTDPASPCRSWGTSSTRGTSSRPKSSCCRRSWLITKGACVDLRCAHGDLMLTDLIVCVCSEETENEVVTPSPSPSPELRAPSRSSAQPESGIKRLWVAAAGYVCASEPKSVFLLFLLLHIRYQGLTFSIFSISFPAFYIVNL